jgi:signal transduction histidine kinase
VPVQTDGGLHGVLAVLTRGAPVSPSALGQCVALGHLMELALANWGAHERLEAEATAEERRRLARDLHDGLAHELAFISSRSASSTAVDPSVQEQIADAAGRALDEARRAITVLTEEAQPFHRSLAHTAEEAAARYGVRLVLELDERVEVTGEVAEQLLRVVREAFANAVRHGQASRVVVGTEATEAGGVRLWVVDDGCGFDPDAGPGGGFGLRSMDERCALVGGELLVRSRAGAGTRVEVALT